MPDKKFTKFQKSNSLVLKYTIISADAALMNDVKDSSGNPGLLLNSG